MEKRNEKGKWWDWFLKYRYILLAAAAGVVLLMLPVGTSSEEAVVPRSSDQRADLAEQAAALQEDMEEILSAVQGVGKVKVLLTIDRGTEQVLAGDTSLTYSGDTAAPNDYSRSTQTVILEESGTDSVVVRQEIWPKYRGAMVVCEGGGDPAVQLAVITSVSALTGLGTDQITVAKWDAQYEGGHES